MAAKKRGPKKAPLTTRRKRFARLVASGMTQTDAAKASGFSPRRAKQTGHELMLDPEVQALVRKELDLSTAQIRGMIQAKARGDAPTKIVKGSGARVEYDMHSALELAAKVDGMLREKVEHSGPNGGPISISVEEAEKLSTEELELLAKIYQKVKG